MGFQHFFNFVKTIYLIYCIKSTTFAPISHLAACWQSDVISIDTHENYQKRSLRNKYRIVGPNGLITLSIPLQKGKHQQQNIKDVKIANTSDWQRQHRETIKSCYGSAPFFEHYADTLFPLLEQKQEFLFDFNLDTRQWMTKALKKPLHWVPTPDFIADEKLPDCTIHPYPQVFSDRHGFVADLSALDLILNMGPQSPQFITIKP